MVQVEIVGDRVHFDVEGWDKLWALRSSLDIPLAHIRGVRIDPDAAAGWWHGIRLPGTNIPGVITAIVMIQAATDAIGEVAEAVAELDGVSEVYSVAGDVDLIAVVRVREFDQVAEVIAGRINKVPGVVDTDTHIAFRAYSRHDLEAAFSIGFETSD